MPEANHKAVDIIAIGITILAVILLLLYNLLNNSPIVKNPEATIARFNPNGINRSYTYIKYPAKKNEAMVNTSPIIVVLKCWNQY